LEERDPQAFDHAAGGERAAASRPYNAHKHQEYGDAALQPLAGEHVALEPDVTRGTRSEVRGGDKTGGADDQDSGQAPPGSLARDRVGHGADRLTTNQGVPVADNQSSLKAGMRGPTVFSDFILREKLTHFDHERIPERVVHARGSGAHGYFECTRALGDITRASPFRKVGQRTPVFVRFSTVAGERGSKDTARDVRGFAVKFYTDEGNWDLVGNNMPVFFVQDAIKFPDLVHAVKPEPHHGMPQAASAHDTFWDFVSLMPESTHMLCWLMSDRAIPRSYRMMQGFGVHTFRFVNAEGAGTFVKFHFTPVAGVKSLVWDEAVKIAGADPDYHRRDLWEAIEAGACPEWTLGVQLFTEEQAETWSFDVLDPTKLVPEELVPVQAVGRLVLDRNPDNFFAETEQVAFCTANVIPGIDFTDDPLLAGRHHSYFDTQLSRLGGPNFHEIPINAPLAPIANHQRDGLHRRAVHRGKVSYEPNSLGGGCPFQAGRAGHVPFAAVLPSSTTLRGKPEKFAEHHAQARLFVMSLSPAERAHLHAAFRFELSKVTVPAIRRRMIAQLRHVDDVMAVRLAEELAVPLPEPAPRVRESFPAPEVEHSDHLSQEAFPGDGTIASRRVAILLADGMDPGNLQELAAPLAKEGAIPCFVAPRLGSTDAGGDPLPGDYTYETAPSVLFDAALVPADRRSAAALAPLGAACEFLRDQYRHGKTIGLVDGTLEVLARFGLPVPESADDSRGAGIVILKPGDVSAFSEALAMHRHPARETDPPLV
jgi:catalase